MAGNSWAENVLGMNALVKTPSEATLMAARNAWLAARIPYQQTQASAAFATSFSSRKRWHCLRSQ
jgi:uncharacterized iron-regulated protein